MVLDETLNRISDLDPIFKVTVCVVVGGGRCGDGDNDVILVNLNLLILQTTISVKVKEWFKDLYNQKLIDFTK